MITFLQATPTKSETGLCSLLSPGLEIREFRAISWKMSTFAEIAFQIYRTAGNHFRSSNSARYFAALREFHISGILNPLEIPSGSLLPPHSLCVEFA